MSNFGVSKTKPVFKIFCERCLGNNLIHYKKDQPIKKQDTSIEGWFLQSRNVVKQWEKSTKTIRDCIYCKDCGYEYCIYTTEQ